MLTLDPTFPHARYHLGVALGDAEQYDEAVDWLQQVIAAEPEHAEAYNSLGYCYSRLGQPAQAVSAYEQAVELQPHYAQAHVNLGMTLLQLGDYPRGFAEYEWRWQTGQFTPFRCPHPPMGRQSDPHQDPAHPYRTGRRRCHPVCALPAAGGPALRQAHPGLWPRPQALLATLPGIAQIRDAGTITVPSLTPILPLLSLPRVFGTTRATIPAAVPYFDVAALRRRTDATAWPALAPSAGPRWGWCGRAARRISHDRQRSCALREFLPLQMPRGSPSTAYRKASDGGSSAAPSEVHVQDLDPSCTTLGTWRCSSTSSIWSSPWTRRWRIWRAPWASRCGCCCMPCPIGAGVSRGDNAVVSDHAAVSAGPGWGLVQRCSSASHDPCSMAGKKLSSDGRQGEWSACHAMRHP